MQRSQLPLLGLRAFEATARHRSVSKAATELCVTPGAISQQVKLFEHSVGVPLLRRKGRAIELTDAGLLLRPQLTQAFDWISTALDSVTRKRSNSTIRLTLLPTLAERWLMPRLARFHGSHPELDIQIMTSFRTVDLEAEDVDIASWVGPSLPAGVSGVRLFDDEFTPACSPKLLLGKRRMHKPADLAHFTLLQAMPRADYWRAWLTQAGVPDLKASHSLSFGSSSLAIQAALDGVGIALVQHAYVKSNLADGTLVAPFDITTRGNNGYYLGWSAAKPVSAAFTLFRDWILEEVRQSA